MKERPPAVAGSFYPAEARELAAVVEEALREAQHHSGLKNHPPKALIAPHAGYAYSGLVAASAYKCLQPFRDLIRRVVILGPSHFVAFRGLAVPSVECFRTPLGPIALDRVAIESLLSLGLAEENDRAHAREHSVETQLPFLQTVLARFTLIPLVVGDTTPGHIGRALEHLWDGVETLLVISSDLTHFHGYATATGLDRQTADAIERFDGAAIGPETACGHLPILGLLQCARNHHLSPRLLDLRNSGDTAGPRDRVVGYGAFSFE